MHKILVQTELPRLRQLGYEVFVPPYLSPIQDQSASLTWDSNQFTTLPKEIFDKLATYNFFYNAISDEMADVLNTYFDTVIVTIEPLWLVEILKTFKGRIIYRLYGYYTRLSKVLESLKVLHMISARDNFWFVPHAIESVENEDSWLREREKIVPYCLTSDIFELTDTWSDTKHKNNEMALTCPNIKNPFYLKHYHFLRKHFYQSHYKYYGVQVSNIKKPNLVGTLSRPEFLLRFQRSSGYLYTYTEPNVCFLPPIEMMILGGPVLYLTGSLLDKYFEEEAPGRCFTIAEAHRKSSLLLKQDRHFIDEIVGSQTEVRARYIPEKVWPVFDRTFNELLQQKNNASRWLVVNKQALEKNKKRIYVFFHSDKISKTCKNKIHLIVTLLASLPEVEICVTAKADQVALMNEFFRDPYDNYKVRILCVDPEGLFLPSQLTALNQKNVIKSFVRMIFPEYIRLLMRKIITTIRQCYNHILSYKSFCDDVNGKLNRTYGSIDLINQDVDCAYVMIPEYHLFPEAMKLNQKTILYSSDNYKVHFFHKKIFAKLIKLLHEKAYKKLRHTDFTGPEYRKNILSLFNI